MFVTEGKRQDTEPCDVFRMAHMAHTAETRGMYTVCWWGNLTAVSYLEALDVGEKIILNWIFS
jgi:hypothetical protein